MGKGPVPKPTSAEAEEQLRMFREKAGNRLHAATIPKWEKFTLLVDSGASDTVVPQNVCPTAMLHWTNKVGVEYEIADGGTLEHLGEKKVLVEDGQGR